MSWAEILLAGLNLSILAFFLPMRTRLRKMQDNELHDLKERLERIESKLDSHFDWHLG
ncbi:MAG: hypothetical protein ACRD5H_01885 [Nitrososphaerales archaeon]